MEIESNPNNKFIIDFSSYDTVGFHATSYLAKDKIESYGFLPNKLFTHEEHENILKIANDLKVDTDFYSQWLRMHSISFAQNEIDALNHINQGNSGGQGLGNISKVLEQILDKCSDEDKFVVYQYIDQINNIRQSPSVIYAVDLSKLGSRLVPDKQQPFFHVYWPYDQPLPKTSEVSPSCLIARLDVK